MGDLVVYDLTAGADSYRVPRVSTYDLQADGKVVRVTDAPGPGGCGGLAWHAPADPSSHSIGGCRQGSPVLSGDRVLYKDTDLRQLRIVSLTGNPAPQTLVEAAGPVWPRYDFDGSRAAYAVVGCLPHLGQIYVDDLSGPPVVEDAKCPFSFISRRINASRRGAASVKASCVQGCGVTLSLSRGRRQAARTATAAVEPGDGSIRVRLTSYARRYLKTHRSLRVRATATVRRRDGDTASTQRILTLTR